MVFLNVENQSFNFVNLFSFKIFLESFLVPLNLKGGLLAKGF